MRSRRVRTERILAASISGLADEAAAYWSASPLTIAIPSSSIRKFLPLKPASCQRMQDQSRKSSQPKRFRQHPEAVKPPFSFPPSRHRGMSQSFVRLSLRNQTEARYPVRLDCLHRNVSGRRAMLNVSSPCGFLLCLVVKSLISRDQPQTDRVPIHSINISDVPFLPDNLITDRRIFVNNVTRFDIPAL